MGTTSIAVVVNDAFNRSSFVVFAVLFSRIDASPPRFLITGMTAPRFGCHASADKRKRQPVKPTPHVRPPWLHGEDYALDFSLLCGKAQPSARIIASQQYLRR